MARALSLSCVGLGGLWEEEGLQDSRSRGLERRGFKTRGEGLRHLRHGRRALLEGVEVEEHAETRLGGERVGGGRRVAHGGRVVEGAAHGGEGHREEERGAFLDEEGGRRGGEAADEVGETCRREILGDMGTRLERPAGESWKPSEASRSQQKPA